MKFLKSFEYFKSPKIEIPCWKFVEELCCKTSSARAKLTKTIKPKHNNNNRKPNQRPKVEGSGSEKTPGLANQNRPNNPNPQKAD